MCSCDVDMATSIWSHVRMSYGPTLSSYGHMGTWSYRQSDQTVMWLVISSYAYVVICHVHRPITSLGVNAADCFEGGMVMSLRDHVCIALNLQEGWQTNRNPTQSAMHWRVQGELFNPDLHCNFRPRIRQHWFQWRRLHFVMHGHADMQLCSFVVMMW